ncbi:MAG: inositol monophosphatase family protein [Kiritimatiellia bacterium]|jgi:myo-inositol-1(or 4)-monophosphatase
MNLQQDPSNEELLATAIAAAEAGAGHAARERARNQEANLIAKHDVKLKLDVECQQIVARAILATFPDHAILGEEDETYIPPPPDVFEWIVDPIDGTVNFFHGNPFWCTSVAVRRNGVALAGCVCAPDMGLRFEASINTPTLRNGTPCHVSDTPTLPLAIVHMGADKAASPESRPFRFFNALAPRIQRPRINGAAALDICLVAAGSADGYFEPSIYIWDIAAADLILRRAGGTGTILREFGGHRLAYLGSNGKIHEPLRDIIDPLF